MDAHMFWAYGNFGINEYICANSFLINGYNLNIWTYGQLTNAPTNALIRDARTIIAEELVFKNKRQSFASFSDLFSYTLLNKTGGLYADTDVVSLKHFTEIPTQQFLVTERLIDNPQKVKINCNVINNPSPSSGNVIDLAEAYASRFRKDLIEWAELGPELLTAIVTIFKNHDFLILPPEFANHINYWDSPQKFINSSIEEIPESAGFLHLYNGAWNLKGVSKEQSFQYDSIIENLKSRYL